jgi:iron complex transport system permease protein
MINTKDVFKNQIQKSKNLHMMMTVLFIMVCILGMISIKLGSAEIDVKSIFHIIRYKVFANQEDLKDLSKGIIAIVWDIRLPRVITAVFVGAGLAVTGTVFQALLRNPLADPYTIGISTGAALGATIAIYVSAIIQIAALAILPSAFIGALITLFIVIKIAGNSHDLSPNSLIVAGIIVSSIGSAAISLLKSLSGDEVGLIVFWLMGSLASRTWQHVLIIVPLIILGTSICIYYSLELNILCSGEENARTYGVNVKKIRMILLVTTSLMIAACVSVSGIIGFVGLVIPHILRQSLTANHRYLIPLSALVGALLLLLADNITRTFLVVEIPVGVLTTLLGGPFFIYLFTRRDGLKGGFK